MAAATVIRGNIGFALNIQTEIKQAQRRFSRSLVGGWETASGTFNVVMAERWEISEDGTGTFIDTGPFGDPRSETKFEWRQHADFVFEIRLVSIVELHNNEASELADEEWQEIRYDFVDVETDVGTEIGLVETDAAGRPSNKFFEALAPLRFLGPASR